MGTTECTSEKQIEGYPTSCPHCGTDLKVRSSVIREYINKDNNPDNNEEVGEDVMAYGHYQSGEFSVDSFEGFRGGRFDLLDDSDKCESCNGQL